MGLPPRPRGRPLVRRAVVASVLVTTGCDQGAKSAPVPESKAQVQVPREVADAAPIIEPVPPQAAPQVEPPPMAPDAGPPQVAPPQTIPPQVAYVNSFMVLLLDEADRPIAKKPVKITLDTGETLTATTSDRGTASFRRRLTHAITVSVSVRGYETLRDVQIESDAYPQTRLVMRKR